MEEKKYYIYRHIRPDKNEPFYIGISRENARRAWEVRSRTKFWHNIVNKNEGNYEIEILLWDLTKKEAEEKEIEFIALYGRRCNDTGTLVNFQAGGGNHTGRKDTPEQIEIKRIRSTGKKYSLGFKHSEATKELWSLIRKGRKWIGPPKVFSDAAKLNMVKGHLGNLSNTGKISITNGVTSTFIFKYLPIPEGWFKGGIKRKLTPKRTLIQ